MEEEKRSTFGRTPGQGGEVDPGGPNRASIATLGERPEVADRSGHGGRKVRGGRPDRRWERWDRDARHEAEPITVDPAPEPDPDR